MENALRDLSLPANWWGYIGSALAATVLIRVFMIGVRTLERHGLAVRSPSWRTYWGYFLGFGLQPLPKDEQPERGGSDDFWQPSILGTFELLVYPMLMASDLAVFIGAWLGFKVAPTLGSWNESRNVYQRFLIGNALALIASWWLMRWFIAY